VLAFIFRVVLSLTLRDDLLLHLFLILNKLDVRDLLLRRWRNQEEECQDKDRNHKRYMDYIGAAGGLRHLQGFVCINLLAMSVQGCVVCIAHGESDECHEETDYHQGSGTAKMQLSDRANQLSIRLHMEGGAEVDNGVQERVCESQQSEYGDVNCCNAQKKHAFSGFAVVKLTESWQ
jgi:hypothetical protein